MLIRRFDKAVILFVAVLRRRITWANNCRKYHFVNTVSWNKQLGVTQLDLNLFLRHQVRQTHREDVWPLLLQQGSTLPFFFGLVEIFLRLLALFDFSDDDLVSYLHTHGVDGRARRCWKDVGSVDGA